MCKWRALQSSFLPVVKGTADATVIVIPPACTCVVTVDGASVVIFTIVVILVIVSAVVAIFADVGFHNSAVNVE